MTTPVNIIDGTDSGEFISDTDANDSINALGGDDTIYGFSYSDDTIDGGDGNDWIWDYHGDNSISGGAGDDTIFGSDGVETIFGGAGDDVISVGSFGQSQSTLIDGGDGDDQFTVNSQGGAPLMVTGGAGSDTYYIQTPYTENNTTVMDFTAGPGGDVLDLADVLLYATGYNGTDPFTAGYVQVVDDGSGNTLVQIDPDGSGSNFGFNTALILKGVDASTLTADNFRGFTFDGSVFAGHLIDGTDNAELLTGTFGNDTIHGLDGDDSLDGDGGDDSIDGGDGGDFIDGYLGSDTINGGDGDDVIGDFYGQNLIHGDAGDDVIAVGGQGTSYLYGDDGDDLFIGSLAENGTDIISGGAGVDTYIFSPNNGHIEITDFEAGDGGDDFVLDAILYGAFGYDPTTNPFATGYIHLEQSGNDVLIQLDRDGTGSAWSPQTVATLKDVQLASLTADNFDGWSPTATAGETIVGTVNDDSNLTGHGGDDLIFALAGNDSLDGGAGDDFLVGDDGNDTLQGGGGGDVMFGGGGDDYYYVDDIGDFIAEDSTLGIDDGGYDKVAASISYTLTDFVEELDLIGTGNINGTGNSGDNWIFDNAGNNSLSGGDGNDTLVSTTGGIDTLVGGNGEDTYWISNASTVITETNTTEWDAVWSSVSYTLGANLEELDLLGAANINATGNAGVNFLYGNGGNNVLNGMSGNDSLIGNAGNDTLQGGGGGDTMWGGSGDDVYYVDNVGDSVYEYAAPGVDDGGYDKVISSISYTLPTYVEELDLLGTGNINGFGNASDNYIVGNSGNNVLRGFDGNDTLVSTNGGNDVLIGGDGDDTYWINNASTVIAENNVTDWDAVWSSVSYTLDFNLEELDLLGSANINATGNAGDNWLFGNSGNNVLSGLSGNDTLVSTTGGVDTLIGGNGDDTYWISSASTVITETNATDWDAVWSSVSYTLGANLEELDLIGTGNINGTGNSGANFLYGNSGANQLSGLNGNDTLVGNGGNDTLTGGAGADSFVFSAAAANGKDAIQDFVHGTDQLWFAGSDYGFATGHTLTASEFTAGSSAVGTSGQFIWNAASHTLYWDDDGTGSHVAIAIATFGGGATVTASDFHFG